MRGKKIVSAVITLVLALLCGLAAIFIALNGANQMPQIRMQNRKADCKGLTLKEFTDFIKDKWLDNVSFSAEQEETEVKGQCVIPTFVNEDYFDIQKLSLDGENFTEDDITNRSRKIIISDTLALKLFLSSNAVGKYLYIDEEKFLVSAVYNEPNDIISKCSADGKDRIFLPYSLAKNSDLAINTVLYKNNSSNAIINQLCANDYKMSRLEQKTKVLNNFVNLTKLTAFIFLSVIIIKLIIRLSKQLLVCIKQELCKKYLLEIFKDNFKYILIRALSILVLLSVPIIIFVLADFNIYIIPDYMPPDNFFDVSYYISKIIELSQMSNAVSLTGNNYYQHLYSISFNFGLIALTFFIIMSIIAYLSMKKLLKSKI